MVNVEKIQAQTTNIGGIINVYDPVVSFNLCNNSVEVVNGNLFSAGDRVLIIQMKGAQIDLSNSVSFGNVLDYGSSGLYEFGVIDRIVGNEIFLKNIMVNVYNPSGKVQMIKVPQYNNVNITNHVFAKDWDGFTGGVVVLEVFDTLFLNADINASFKGFRGGNPSTNFWNPSTCSKTEYFFNNNNTFSGEKGEGISDIQVQMNTGKGKAANGGGGGNYVNAGGGGGSNISRGGNGGFEWSGCSNNDLGGRGGLELTNQNERVFLGGGGGGPQQNNRVGIKGGAGGGIIIVYAKTIISQVYQRSFVSFGESVYDLSGNDGAGGGGGGGSVYLVSDTVIGQLLIDVSGGKGGDVTNAPFTFQCHGGGGGGSGGVIRLNKNSHVQNATLRLSGGNLGKNLSNNQSNSDCFGLDYGAQNGLDGITAFNLNLAEGKIEFKQMNADTTLLQLTCLNPDSNSILITVTNGLRPYSISWSDPTLSGFSVSKLLPGSYQYTISDARGCSISQGFTITPKPPCCSFDATTVIENTLCNLSIGKIEIFPDTLTGTGIAPFEFSIDSGIIFSYNNVFADLGATSFQVMARDANGCEFRQNVNILEANNTISLSFDVTNVTCAGGADGSISANVSGDHPPFSYLWNTADTSVSIFNLNANSFSLTVTDSIGCTRTDFTNISEPAAFDLGNDIFLCEGQSAVLNAGIGTQFIWSTGGTDSIEIVSDEGVVFVEVTDSNGCVAIDSINITVGDVFISVFADSNIITRGDTIALFSSGTDSDTLLWTNTQNLTCSDCPNPLAFPRDTTIFSLTFTDTNGCSATDSILIYVKEPVFNFFMPNAFSPNNDGHNDFIFPIMNGVKQFTWRIFDRWGEKVFECANSPVPCRWDGTFKGKKLKPVVLVWEAVVEFKEPSIKKYKGSLTLIE